MDAKSFLTKVRTRISSGERARSVVPFERKNAIRSDKTQLHVLIDTRITEEATHTRERHTIRAKIITCSPFFLEELISDYSYSRGRCTELFSNSGYSRSRGMERP